MKSAKRLITFTSIMKERHIIVFSTSLTVQPNYVLRPASKPITGPICHIQHVSILIQLIHLLCD